MPARLLADRHAVCRGVARLALAAGMVVAVGVRAAWGQTGPSPEIAGTVTDADAGTPLADVTVLVPGTLLRADEQQWAVSYPRRLTRSLQRPSVADRLQGRDRRSSDRRCG